MTEKQQVRVGLGVVIISDGKILLGERIGTHSRNTWAPPGGHLEFGESWADCAAREVREETGLTLSDVQFVYATNDIYSDEAKHYVTILVRGVAEGEPKLLEPAKCTGWQWFALDALPAPLFSPFQQVMQQHPELLSNPAHRT